MTILGTLASLRVRKENEDFGIVSETLRHCLCFLVSYLIECRITACDIFIKQDGR